MKVSALPYQGMAPFGNVRDALNAARQHHMVALQAAIAAGVPADELTHDADAHHSAVKQLLRICRTVGVDAPVVLV